MLIDPSSLLAGDPSKLAAKTSTLPPEIDKLISELKLVTGQQVEASVSKITTLTKEEKTIILELKNREPAPLTRKENWQKLLNDPNLKLVELKVNQKLINTLTSAPLLKGQTIKILITKEGLKLVIDNETALKPKTPTASNTKNSTSPSPTSQEPKAKSTTLFSAESKTMVPLLKQNPLLSAKLSASLPPPKSLLEALTETKPATLNTLPATKQLEAILKQTLNKALPLAEKHDKLFNIIERLTVNINKWPQKEVPQQLNQLIKTLKIQAQSHNLNIPIKSTPSPTSIKQALQNSGSLYEQQAFSTSKPTQKAAIPLPSVANSSSAKSSHSKTSLPLTTSPPSTINKSPTDRPETTPSSVLNSINTAATTNKHTTVEPAKDTTPSTPQKVVDADLKGSLIQLSEWLQQANQVSKLPNSKLRPDDVIAKLWLNLLQTAEHKNTPLTSKQPLKALYQAMQQLIQSSLARIQVQQFKTLASSSQDPTTAQSVLHMDIPIRTPEGYSTIYLQLFEPKITEEEEKRQKGKKKEKKQAKWRVFMELELADEGDLAIEISVCDKKVDATFWAEKEALRKKTEANIEQLKTDLEQKGLEVTDLRCSKNTPPKQKMQMDFSLIDVRT